MTEQSESPWPRVVDLARWSPSVHNTQAWKVRPTSATTAELRYEPRRLLALTDADGRFWTIGMGVFVTCLEVAAASLGYALDVDYPETRLDPTASGSQPFASMSLSPSTAAPDFAVELIKQRRTSRIRYDGRPVPASAADELVALAAARRQTMSFTSDPETVRWVDGLNIDTLFYDLRHEPARREIGLWIRRSDREARQTGDGFAPRCIGFNGRLLHLFFHRHTLFDQPVVRDLIRMSYARSYRGTATVGWITSAQERPEQWFEAGRSLGEIWLAATRAGLVLHPYGSVVTNPAAHRKLVERLHTEVPGHETWLLFRMGYSARPARSARIPLTEIME